MARASRDFQIFVKPGGPACNLDCQYCYYRDKLSLYPNPSSLRMPEELLEDYIVQHIQAATGPEVNFSWHGGEPTTLGLGFFRKAVELQGKHRPLGWTVRNGIQTNGILLNEEWGRFLRAEGFSVGLSLDGPAELHDPYRVNRSGQPTHREAMRAYELLRRYEIHTDVLCVVHRLNVRQPLTVYRFFRGIGCRYLGFLPAVNPTPARAESARAGDPARDPAVPDAVLSQQAKTGPAGDPVLPQQAKTGPAGDPVLPQQAKTGPAGDPVDAHTPAAEDYGAFLSRIFDEWIARDTGRIMIQTFEEAARPALGLEHSLCVFRETCGQIPVLEHNGDFFPCDHFVDAEHRLGNIRETPLAELLDSPALRAFGEVKRTQLPKCCRECEVLAMCNGGCPKYRFIRTPEGEPGLNYLCAGLKRFFLHSREPLARWLGRQQPPATKPLAPTEIAGRNGPCPCGSGLKYKKCCAGKREGYGGT